MTHIPVDTCAICLRKAVIIGISVILITQNIFHQAKHCRDISLNAKFMIILKTAIDASSPVWHKCALIIA